LGNRKSGILFIIIVLICQTLFATVSEENIKTYESLNELQKDPKNLEYALDCTLSTIMYGENNFPSEEAAEKLLKRIYTKIELTRNFQKDNDVVNAIIRESTNDLLEALQNIDEETDKYQETYVLLDFLYKDFSLLIEQFHFEQFKKYFQINKLQNLHLIDTIDGKQLQKLTTYIIDTIIENDYYLNNKTYSEIVKMGKEKFLNYLSIQINPYLDKKQINTYQKQYSLLKAYINFFQAYFGDMYREKIPKEKYSYFLELEEYFDYFSNVEILSRRFLTAETETLNNLFPIFMDYIDEFQTLVLKSENLNTAVLKMIKNASTRLSYEKIDLQNNNYDFNEMNISNEEIKESLRNLFSTMNTNFKREVPEKKDILTLFVNNSSLIITIFVLTAFLVLLILILPLKLKGSLLKNIGLNSRALSLFEKAAIKHPMDPDIHIKTAQIYEKLGREEDAMNEYKIASRVMDMNDD